nr:glycyl-radical enzyme activating protein [Eubacterium sp.]
SVHDGKGIRTVVFLKGCPLRCAWCANPESQRAVPEMGWTKGLCIGCGECRKKLPNLSCHFEEGGEGRLFWDTGASFDPEAARKVCPSEAFHVIGKEMSAEEVLEEVLRDRAFYDSSFGGITLSGGEPLMQADFACEILLEAGKHGLHRAIETCGYASWEKYERVVALVDELIADVKLMDTDKHKVWTGRGNEPVLENLRRARETFPGLPIHVRTPVIPDVNDTEEEITAIRDFAKEIGADYELLRYHRLGEPKYESLNRVYPMGTRELSARAFRELQTYISQT